ncbi:MAG: sulfotransferase [Roseiarcus sp.]|uniref:sulfotransferase n=1 Tax=Roseiarcus sp. TaxID=1969460 RepID=UPI003C38C11B
MDALTRALDLTRYGRRTPFDVFMSFIPAEKSNYDFNLAGAKVTPIILRGREPVPLAIYVTESNSGGDPLFEFAYHPDHLDEASVDAIRERLAALIDAFSLAPTVKPGELPDLRRPAASLAPTDDDAGSLASPAVWNVRIAGTFTIEPIVPALQFWMRKLGLDARVDCAGYNQVFQSLLDPTSALRANPRGVNVVMLRIEDWLRDRVEPTVAEIAGDDVAFLRETAMSFTEALREAADSSSVRWIVLLTPPTPAFGAEGFHNAIQVGTETLIAEALADMGGVELVHYTAVRALYPTTLNGVMGDKAKAVARYNDYIGEVKAAVPPDKLLIFRVTDGWDPLCAFLSVAKPETDFPNLNDRASTKKNIGCTANLANLLLAGIAAAALLVSGGAYWLLR